MRSPSTTRQPARERIGRGSRKTTYGAAQPGSATTWACGWDAWRYLGDVTTARAHVRGHNHRLIGIALMGDFSATHPDSRNIVLLRELIAAVREHFGRELPVIGHSDLVETACPGERLYEQLGELGL